MTVTQNLGTEFTRKNDSFRKLDINRDAAGVLAKDMDITTVRFLDPLSFILSTNEQSGICQETSRYSSRLSAGRKQYARCNLSNLRSWCRVFEQRNTTGRLYSVHGLILFSSLDYTDLLGPR